ncbi:hypothetical protein KFL_000560390 [Klebsormidium nitens]|uniref:Uncharacterized protein n=1 Tax=Klebsormidium nitens TaxID=105231 RepID=A0A1Y1HPJ5_KLENI|nr:hypothetical protein KFL_000560390 [Klebsormidium nitens]|eukprot:GAQ80550.1 hypothetical protein KFL_000560390 [Klebsormidium nitens]
MAHSGLLAVCLAVIICLSAKSVDARRKLFLDHSQGPLTAKSQQQHQVMVLEEDVTEVHLGRRGLVLLQQDPYDAGFAVTPPALEIVNVAINPTTPTAQQAYSATVFLLGGSPGQSVQIRIDGSDGFTFTTPGCTIGDATFPQGAGSCKQTIPGSPFVGSTDTLTATITGTDGTVLVSLTVQVGPFQAKS